MERAYRVRRSCLAVPASSERFIEKARGLIDEASRKLAEVVVARGNAAGFGKTGEAP
jgi:hypothetical protein